MKKATAAALKSWQDANVRTVTLNGKLSTSTIQEKHFKR